MKFASFIPLTSYFLLHFFYQDFTDRETLLQQFGKHRSGAGCVYIKKLQDINIEVLAKLITSSVKYLQQKYPS